MRGRRSPGTESRESWNPPAVLLTGSGWREGRWWSGGEGEKSTQSTPPSAVSRVGWVTGWQEEKTCLSSLFLMVRVWLQPGGRDR